MKGFTNRSTDLDNFSSPPAIIHILIEQQITLDNQDWVC